MEAFDRTILHSLEALFSEDEIKTLIYRSDPDEIGSGRIVKVIHQPTDTEVVCDVFDTQIENKAVALARLLETIRNS